MALAASQRSFSPRLPSHPAASATASHGKRRGTAVEAEAEAPVGTREVKQERLQRSAAAGLQGHPPSRGGAKPVVVDMTGVSKGG